MRTVWPNRLWLLACLLAFATPLFVGLDHREMHNDEAIYSYAVERMIDTGDWATPRSIPTDHEFLEKPPLKIWLVSSLMTLGVVPRDELGLRLLDAVFGTITFAYVFWFGLRLRGRLAGVVAVLVLVTYHPLVFDHGLRSNNMEAALVLAYVGGLWHALGWSDGGPGSRRHAWCAAGYFVLGFMTKYIAALFLPAIALLWWAWRPGGLRDLGRRSTEWFAPALGALALIAPWFIYESWLHGRVFWEILLGQQVLDRFTAGVDPAHLAPWHFYLSQTWHELSRAGTQWFVMAGFGLLMWRAVRHDDAGARLALVWWVLPISLISLGSSKLVHYSYPFLPPLALGAGLAVSMLIDFLGRVATTRLFPAAGRRHLSRLVPGGAVLLLGFWLSWPAYAHLVETARQVYRPVATMATCVAQEGGTGVYVIGPERLSHTYFYYLRHAGPWVAWRDDQEETRRRILSLDIAEQTPVLMTREVWRQMRVALDLPPMKAPGTPGQSSFDVGLQFDRADVLLVPPRFRRCLDLALATGGHRLEPDGPP
ncbi:MAG TPA: glycosyltransferase family 39 protein [Vicinamibacterales bacterium]|nr:glycosyltransferase family 39 protein [Vicinamibacterales bacterium]